MSKDKIASYYDAGGIETLDIIKAKLTPEQYQGYLLGCSLKYQCRLMHKFSDEKDRKRDAQKAYNYARWLVETFKQREGNYKRKMKQKQCTHSWCADNRRQSKKYLEDSNVAQKNNK